jgi:hypothetical protein
MSLSNEDIKQLIAILHKGLSSEEIKETDTPDTQPSDTGIHSSAKGKKQKAKVAKNNTETYNKFDVMQEKNMHKDDLQIDKVLSKYAPTSRSREFNSINVVCRVCGKKEDINPGLIYDAGRYKCNKCSTISG